MIAIIAIAVVAAIALGIFVSNVSAARRPAKRASELQRTCSRCGTDWYLTATEARMRPPNRMEMTGQRMSAAGEGMSLFSSFRGRELQKLQRLEARKAAIEALARCPNCGSQSFTEQWVVV
jgi:ribosomal protein S27AE